MRLPSTSVARIRVLAGVCFVILLTLAAAGSLASVEVVPASDDRIDTTAATDPPESNVTVAVVDSGIDDSHPGLERRVVDRIDLTGDTPQHPDKGTDIDGHGTAVAGVVAGTGVAGDGRHVGVAPGAELVDVRVMTASGDRNVGGATIAEGIEYAVEEADADIVLLSLSAVGSEAELVETRVEWATRQGVLVVASAGNADYPRSITTPGTSPSALTVGATDGNGGVLERSARGPTLDGVFKPELVAPGEDITVPQPMTDHGDPYVQRSGTSLAAARVAGTAARLVAADPTLERSPRELERRLTSTARPIDSANGYTAGSGELDVQRAIEPAIVTDGAVDVDPLTAPDNRTVTVGFENHHGRPITLPLSTTAVNVDTDVRMDSALRSNRSELQLQPGATATVELEIAGDIPAGAYAGTLEYTVGGEPRSVAIGFVRGGTVTVEKQPLSADGRVDGDPLVVFTEDGTHEEVLEFDDGTATFLAGGGTYVLWSSGLDRTSGSLIFLSERLTVDRDRRVALDEASTVPAGVDVGPLETAYGPLETRSITATMVTESGSRTERLSRQIHDADNRTVRMSRDPKTTLTSIYHLTTPTDLFHLSHQTAGTRWLSPRTVRPDELQTKTYRVGRSTVDRLPEIRERASLPGSQAIRQLSTLELEHHRQQVHTTPELRHERSLRFNGQRAVLDTPTDDNPWAFSHPLFATADLKFSDGKLAVRAHPLADGANTRLYTGSDHSLTVSTNETTGETRRSGHPTISIDGIETTANAEVRIDGTNPESWLSTRTRTEITIRNGTEAAPVPLPRNVRVDGISPTGAVDPGRTTIRIDANDYRTVSEATVWHAVGSHETPPWENTTDWTATPAGPGYESIRTAIDIPETAERETVSLAASLKTAEGNTVQLLTTDAFHVGTAPNTETRFIEGQLLTAEGVPADNDTIVVRAVDGDRTNVVRTGADGYFSAEVPRDERYDLVYRRGNPWSITDTDRATTPELYALDRVNTTEDIRIDRTVPVPAPLTVHSRDERNMSVNGSTVRIAHSSDNVTAEVTLRPDENGTIRELPVSGQLLLTVEPPADPAFVDEQLTETVTVENETILTFAHGTEPPTATLSATRQRMLEGTPTTLDASESDVPADAAEYRWDIDGDNTIDRVTTEPRVRYVPPVGVSNPSVTVVDKSNNTDTDSIRLSAIGRD